MPLTVIFARHGESQANIDRVFANRPGVPNDLTPAGIGQAEALARSLARYRLVHVYTSPLRRAAQTAAIIASQLRVPLTESDALREYDIGDFEGLPYSGAAAWRWERYMEVERAWRSSVRDARHPGGESLADLEARFLPFMHALASRHAGDETILAISHGGFLRAVLPALFPDLSPDFVWDHTLGHGDLVIGEHHDNRWHCTLWTDWKR